MGRGRAEMLPRAANICNTATDPIISGAVECMTARLTSDTIWKCIIERKIIYTVDV